MTEERTISPTTTPQEVAPLDLPYLPQDPKSYHPQIALVGCGGIAPYHLRAYKAAGYNITALCDINTTRAGELAQEFFPEAQIYADYQDMLKRDDIEVVDIATHPEIRPTMVEKTLRSGKHVLSQKPFVMSLEQGHRLCDLADELNLKLAVNQNGRWAPHFGYMRAAVEQGVLGKVVAAHLAVHWDHNWTAGTAFDAVRHLILYDFGIHWYDILGCFMMERMPQRVFASTTSAPGQRAKPSLLAQVSVEYEGAQASIAFDGSTRFGARDTTIVVGTEGTAESTGIDVDHQQVTLHTASGHSCPTLQGEWFTNGFHGTMGELLCAIEENRTPSNNGRDNLKGLALCYAAVASAEDHEPKTPGEVDRLFGI
jgi:predicted dehydrogenase